MEEEIEKAKVDADKLVIEGPLRPEPVTPINEVLCENVYTQICTILHSKQHTHISM